MPKVRTKAYIRGEQITVSIPPNASEEVLELINSFTSLSNNTIQIIDDKARKIYGSNNDISCKSIHYEVESSLEKEEDKKIYKRGDKYNIVIPKDANEELMKWINTRKFVSPQIMEVLEEIAVKRKKEFSTIKV